MPGTFVAIGLNSPRTVSVASGFISHRSIWLGAPQLKIKMTDFAFPPARGTAPARRDQPLHKAAAAPAEDCKNSRRDRIAIRSVLGGKSRAPARIVPCPPVAGKLDPRTGRLNSASPPRNLESPHFVRRIFKR